MLFAPPHITCERNMSINITSSTINSNTQAHRQRCIGRTGGFLLNELTPVGERATNFQLSYKQWFL